MNKLLDGLKQDIDRTLEDAKVAYREHLVGSLVEVFKKYLKLGRKK